MKKQNNTASFAKQNWKRRAIHKSMKDVFTLHCNSANTLPQFCSAKLEAQDDM